MMRQFGNTWDYWAFGLCPLSDILKHTKEPAIWKLDLFPSSGESVGDTLLDLLERANPNHWTLALSNRPK
jgi:hypothetical protein